jgi:hypothetical protein
VGIVILHRRVPRRQRLIAWAFDSANALLVLLLLACTPALAQNWELGIAGGYGLYRNGRIFSPNGTIGAGFRNRFAVSAVLGEELYEHLGGEFRFTYHDGDPFLEGAGAKTNLEGHSHAFNYNLLLHIRRRDRAFRPYVSVGGGMKQYIVNGPENPFPPLRNVAVLTRTDELKPLFTAGAGAKLRIASYMLLRFDFLDYMTQFPKDVITPVPPGNARGILHQFTPMLGVSFTF